MKTNRLTLTAVVLLVSSDLIEVALNFCFKLLSDLVPVGGSLYSFQALLSLSNAVVRSPFFWIAIVCTVLSFVTWFAILAHIDLSIAFPLASLSFILIPILSVVILHEEIPPLRWYGIGCIVLGIAFLAFEMLTNKKAL